jgi:hypothetical protein
MDVLEARPPPPTPAPAHSPVNDDDDVYAPLRQRLARNRQGMVEQNFNSHLVPEQHRVRQATSEFRDFAIIWWNELVNPRAAP